LPWAIELYKATGEFVFAPEERDVYSGRTPTDLAPLGAKPGSSTFAEKGKSDCAPSELRSKKKERETINIPPLWGEATTNALLHFQVEFAFAFANGK
jgi:hypothetical protein